MTILAVDRARTRCGTRPRNSSRHQRRKPTRLPPTASRLCAIVAIYAHPPHYPKRVAGPHPSARKRAEASATTFQYTGIRSIFPRCNCASGGIMTQQSATPQQGAVDPRSEEFVAALAAFLLERGTLDELAVHR